MQLSQVTNFAPGGGPLPEDTFDRRDDMYPGYAHGGMTQMARGVANQGRMGDSMMVHMSPQEVAGLQALARSRGTSMTVNPKTGMPEAFNLGALLPLAAGFALGPAGLELMSAAQAGLAVGAATAAATGSLKKGLQAGLGAYGGAGLGEGLVSTATPSQGASIASPGTVGGTTGSTGLTVPTAGMTPTVSLPAATSPFEAGAPLELGSGIGTSGFPTYGQAESIGGAAGSTGLVGAPATSASSAPFANMSNSDLYKYGSAAGTSVLSGIEPPKRARPPTGNFRPYTYSFNENTGAYEPTPGDTSEKMYGYSTFTPGPVTQAAGGGLMGLNSSYAAGGLAAFAEGGRPKSRPLTGPEPYHFQTSRQTMLDAVEKNFAKGGRFLVGDGDGMSDSIHANIEGKQPARLADGEFVIPADVVSHLGNGSSKAGAERLHDMMERIRRERTGKERQAPQIKPEKFMPA